MTRKKKSSTEEFEEALKSEDKRRFHLRLFVTGITPRSVEAIEKVRQLCEEHLKGRYELEIVDVYTHPDVTKDDQVLAAPTLVRLLPLPVRKIVGDMTHEEKILAGLEVKVSID